MNRDAVLSLIRSHLSDELEVDGERIDESTRFKEDLEADSLDLYTLVQVTGHPVGAACGLQPAPFQQSYHKSKG